MTTTPVHPGHRDDRPTASWRRRCAALLVAVAAVTAGATTASADGGRGRHGPLQQALDDVVAAGVPGAIVLVRDGSHTTKLASGVGNLEPETPIRVADRARFGGITKSFTATVVLQLVAEGRLSLDHRLEQWLPGAIPNGADITVRQLLNHTSGIFNYAMDETILAPYLEGDLTHPFDPMDGVRSAAAHGPDFAPGTALGYSNTNYVLLGMIVEQVTGNTFSSELTRRIIEPLGLHDTTYPPDSVIRGRHVHGYFFLPEPFDVTSWNPSLYGASGALLSNAHDVARFYRALLQGRLLPPAQLAEMKTIDPAAVGGVPDAGILGGGWGLGLLREEFPCGVAWGHDSEIPGYMKAAWNSEDGRRQVVVIVNSHFDHDAPVSVAMRALLVTAFCGP
jgi:D-alanyl-D-alanine carboxypeptidase